MEVIYHYDTREFFESLQIPTRAKLTRSIRLLREYGQNLGMPHMKFVVDGIFELRIRGQQEVRVFLVFRQGQAHLIHGFIKKTQKTPKRELEIAKTRKVDLT